MSVLDKTCNKENIYLFVTLTFQYKTRELFVLRCSPCLAFVHVKYLDVGKGMMASTSAFFLVRPKLLNYLFFHYLKTWWWGSINSPILNSCLMILYMYMGIDWFCPLPPTCSIQPKIENLMGTYLYLHHFLF
jgi:hypothetical protein